MIQDSLGLELMELYRRLREATDPAIKAVIRRRIDSKLARGGMGGFTPAAEGREAQESGAD